MQLSEILATLTRQGDRWQAEVDDSWLQGRSVYGGLQVMLAAKAMREEAGPERALRTLQTTFLAPVAAGPISFQVRTLREGKNTLQLEARLVDGDDTLCLVIGIFGSGRESAVESLPTAPERSSKPPFDFPYVPGLTPEFTQHFRARWRKGYLPFSGATRLGCAVEVGLKEELAPDELFIIAIADFMPPVALSHLTKPAAASSLTWLLEFFHDGTGLSPSGWIVDAELEAAHSGYTSQSMKIWGPNDELVALSRQSMVIFG